MAEKSNAQLLAELERKIRRGKEGGALSKEKVAGEHWYNENTGWAWIKGKKVRVWTTGPNKGKKYDPKKGSKLFLKEYYGTETPRKDLQYLQEAELSRRRILTRKNDSVRRHFSDKLIGYDPKTEEGKYLTVYDKEIEAFETKEQSRLHKLSKGTSFFISNAQRLQQFKNANQRPVASEVPSDSNSNKLKVNNKKEEEVIVNEGTPNTNNLQINSTPSSKETEKDVEKEVPPNIPNPIKKEVKKEVNTYGINISDLKRRTGLSLKEFERQYRANQVFDTSKKFGVHKGGFFVNDTMGVPRFIAHKDRGRKNA